MTRSSVGDVVQSLGESSLNAGDLELLRHLEHGMSTSQIAAAMFVTSNTTRGRIRRVERKLAVWGRGQMVEAAHAIARA
jgi:DNA-binding CsgD family transcriptional regulator